MVIGPILLSLLRELPWGLLIGMLSVRIGSFCPDASVALAAPCSLAWCAAGCARRPTFGNYPPAAQQTLSDIGLGGFIAAIGLANGPAALTAIQSHGVQLLSLGVVVTLVPLTIATIVADRVLHLNSSHHLRRARGSDDRGRGRHRMLRTGGQSDAGPWGCRALCGRKRTPDHPRPCNSCTHLRRVMLPARG